MVKVRLLATLKERVGKEIVEVEAQTLQELARKLSHHIPDIIDPDGRPSGLYLFLINGADYRVRGENPELSSEDEVIIIPVSHGG
uniref:MoaD/ThiS family protein n=1 Tax=Fervidicoccus fontis TaxID=683846 RepID=A0A7J3ZIF9_9CREN